jgi:SAM-dependent methyltransferase
MQDLEKSHYLTLFKAYGFYQGEGIEYINTHLTRYLATLDFIPKKDNLQILELGAYPAFSLMLKWQFPDANIILTENRETRNFEVLLTTAGDQSRKLKPRIYETALKSLSNDVPSLHFTCAQFNMEKEHWPFEDHSFDIVLSMEILEHLLLDPCFSFREANRVLKYGGAFILTTPSIARYESVVNLLNCRSPHTFGIYSRHGAYGRHNREYIPWEVARLGECSGFQTDVLTTKDVYPYSTDITSIQELLLSWNDDATMRGQTIFYCGIKVSEEFGQYPSELYDYDPKNHKADLQIKRIDRQMKVGGTFKMEVNITNLSQYTWRQDGPDKTRLGIMLLDANKQLLDRDFRRVGLYKEVHPGETITITCDVGAPDSPGNFVLHFDMVHEFICWFADESPNYSVYVDVAIISDA